MFSSCPGYCLLLADPVVASLNDLADARRAEFLRDMARLGDAILRVTSADRINYEILGQLRAGAARACLPPLRDRAAAVRAVRSASRPSPPHKGRPCRRSGLCFTRAASRAGRNEVFPVGTAAGKASQETPAATGGSALSYENADGCGVCLQIKFQTKLSGLSRFSFPNTGVYARIHAHVLQPLPGFNIRHARSHHKHEVGISWTHHGSQPAECVGHTLPSRQELYSSDPTHLHQALSWLPHAVPPQVPATESASRRRLSPTSERGGVD
jgi:hypothetical protein